MTNFIVSTFYYLFHSGRWFTFHFELDKDKGMDFSNYGLYEIDHTLPSRLYNSTNTTYKEICTHWSNLRPLLADENRSKDAEISEEHISIQNVRLQIFCKQENIPLRQIAIPTGLQDEFPFKLSDVNNSSNTNPETNSPPISESNNDEFSDIDSEINLSFISENSESE
jgi:hypothetical protein